MNSHVIRNGLRGLSFALVLTGVRLHAAEWYVDAENGSDVTGNGSSALPFATINAATTNKNLKADDVVWVRPGTYSNGVATVASYGRSRVCIPKKIRLESTGGCDVTHIVGFKDTTDPTGGTGKCLGCGTDSLRGICAAKADTIIKGFTIRDGASAYTNTNAKGTSFEVTQNMGGGVLGADCTVVVADCVISNCTGRYGGAMNKCVAVRCLLTENTGSHTLRNSYALNSVLTGNSPGTAILSSSRAVNCTVAGNPSGYPAHAGEGYLLNCIVTENYSSSIFNVSDENKANTILPAETAQSVVNAADGDCRLAKDSPAIGYGERQWINNADVFTVPVEFATNDYAGTAYSLTDTTPFNAGAYQTIATFVEAPQAAESSGDKRAIEHVRRDRDMFNLTWRTERKRYLESFKELNVYRKTGEIRIDGVLDEADWANADALGNFKAGGMTACHDKNAHVEPTTVRVVYEPEALYVAVECMEPTPEKIVAGTGLDKLSGADRWRALGNHIELFYNYPDMFEMYYHLGINSKGEIIPAIQLSGTQRDNDFKTRAQYAVKVLKDRWIVEIAIPTSEIGMKCFDGATWKLNVGRSRKLTDSPSWGESSSCCNGAFKGASNFVNIKFVPSRAKGLHQGRSVSAWSNAGFEETISNAKVNRHYRWKALTFSDGDDLVPSVWHGKDLCGEYLREDANRFLRLKPGKGSCLSQYYVSDAPGKVRISFRLRGTGKVSLWTALYTDTPTRHGYALQDGSAKSETFTVTPEWQTFTVDRVKNGKPTERMAVRFTPQKGSEIDIDDVIVSPVE